MPSSPLPHPRPLAAALFLAAGALLACGRSHPPAQNTGVARVVAACQGSCAEIDVVQVTVGPGDGPGFTPFTSTIPSTGANQWSLRIPAIPAGPARLFQVSALDARRVLLFSGSAKVDVVAGQTLVVSITLQAAAPPNQTNQFPVIDSLTYRSFVRPLDVLPVAVTAHDPDPGDTLGYLWRATCGTFDQPALSAPTWTAPATEGPCELSVTVQDGRGAATTASFAITVTSQLGDANVTVDFKTWPIIASFNGTLRLGTDLEGELRIFASSPDGDPLGYAWSSTCPGLVFDLTPPYGPTFPHFRLAGPSAACQITATVSVPWSAPGGTTATLGLPPNTGISTACANRGCPPIDRCHGPGACDPVAGTCTPGSPVACPSATPVCDRADGLCKATIPTCSGVSCPPLDRCHAAGSCDPVSASCVPGAPVTCPPIDLCHQAGTCDLATGACQGGAPTTCPANQTCDPADGTCKAAAPSCAGVTCAPAVDLCHQAGTCQPSTGTCSAPTAVSCPANQACDPADGTCKAAPTVPVPVPQAAAQIPMQAITAASDATGATYVAGPLFNTQAFGALSLTSAGSADVGLVKYDPVTHQPLWARAFGGGLAEASTATDQFPTGAAVTQDGTVVVIGSTTGNMVLNGATVAFPAAPQDFIIGVNGATGVGKFILPVNTGTGGALTAVAGNPNSNNFAVCGYTNIVSSLAQAGVVAPTGTQATDAVIGVYTSAGVLVWSKQIASGSFEDCSTIAMDDAGHVLVAGKYGSATAATSVNPGLGALPATGLATRRFIWVAKYDGPTGAPIAQAGYGAGNGIQVPRTSTVDAGGNLILGGSFVNSLPFGTGALTLAGVGQDAFVAKFGVSGTATAPGAFTPAWAVRLGGTGNTDAVTGLAAASTGDVLATGTFATTSTGALTLTSSGLSDDVFLVKLDAGSGVTQFQAAYGDASNQAGGVVLVNRSGATRLDLLELVASFDGTVNFGPPVGSLSALTRAGFIMWAPIQ